MKFLGSLLSGKIERYLPISFKPTVNSTQAKELSVHQGTSEIYTEKHTERTLRRKCACLSVREY